MKTFINKVGWYDMLTLDHKVCRVCFNQAPRSQPNINGAGDGRRRRTSSQR